MYNMGWGWARAPRVAAQQGDRVECRLIEHVVARRHAVDCHPERMSRSPEPFASLKGKLREGEGSDSPGTEILRCAQDDMRGWAGRPRRSPRTLS